MVFYIKSYPVNYQGKVPDDFAKNKIAEYIIPPQVVGAPLDTRYLSKGVELLQDKKKTSRTETETQVIEPEDSQFEFMPFFRRVEGQNHRIMVTGKSGSGKSTQIGRMLDQMAHTSPDKQIVIISWVRSDPELDRIHHQTTPIRIQPEQLYEMQIDKEYFENCIIVFDDVEKNPKKDIVKYLIRLRDEIFEAGRHQQCDIISVSHDALGGNLNKTVKMEATSVYLYPNFNQFHTSQAFLKKYVGLNQQQIDEVVSLPSRWVFINLVGANYYISEKKAKLLI
jgi:energy-coupling factor transporter ATP-binding protein EcfA2